MNYIIWLTLNRITTISLLLGMVFLHSLDAKAAKNKFMYPSINDTLSKKNGSQDTLKKGTKSWQKEGGDIYSKLKSNANKRYATRKLYGLFFRNQNAELAGRVLGKFDATDRYIKYAGKRINHIKFSRLKAFGQSVFDSTLRPNTWAENAANSMHIETAKFLIRHTILFKEGESLNPIDFAESEQLLRNLDYIEDANIVVENADDTTAVNVYVITKDAWSIGIDYRYGNKYSSQMQIYDKNLGGLGVFLNSNLYYDSRKSNVLGRKYELSLSNIGGTFIDGDVWERRGQGYETYAISLKRDFYASKTHFAGGAGIVISSEPYSFRTIDTTQQIDYTGHDYWIGRSIRVSRKDFSKSPYNLVVALRYFSKYFTKRPDVSITTNYFAQNKEYYIVGLSLSQQSLFKANLIYSFGSTEDIPTGFRIHFTSGFEKGEFQNRYYFGSEFSAADLDYWGYLFLSTRTGGFITKKTEAQQFTINVRSTYFSNLVKIGNFEFRQFAKFDFTRGIGRFEGEGETIFLDENNGVRGLTSRAMSGTVRFVANLETVAFSPLYIYGFRFAFFAFYDFGVIGSADDYLFGNQSYSGFGLGVRIRNENLVLNTLQIRLGYYPKLPTNADVSYWLVTGQQRTRFENFRAVKPQVIPFE